MERQDLSGQVLDGRYRVIERVGKGGMGSVYRADDQKLRRTVAVKVMNEHVPEGLGARKRFEREARAMAMLEHPHCASILDVGMHDGHPFVVMDFIAGQSLDELVASGPLPIARAVEITRQILFGLAHAHEHGIVHRDIKPANIVLSQKAGMGDHVKILDFGLAKIGQETSNLTAGVIVGTPSYMSPEQIRGLLLDGRADVYACGVLLFELLTGHKPFRAETPDPLATCMMHLSVPPPRLADKLPGDFGALEDVIEHALAKERDQRFSSAMAFANALAAAIGSRASSPVIAAPEPVTTALGPIATQPTQLAPNPTVALGDHDLLRGPSLVALPHAPPPPRSRKRIEIAAASLCAVVAIVIAAVAAPSSSASQPTTAVVDANRGSAEPVAVRPPADDPPASLDPPDPNPAPDDAVARVIAKADQHLARRWRDGAIDVLVKARRTYPDDPRLPYRAGLLYLEKLWWPDGLKQLRAAIALDPALREDPALIRAAVRAFIATAQIDWQLASFLRNDIGVAARPFLEEVVAQDKNAFHRNRAKAELARR